MPVRLIYSIFSILVAVMTTMLANRPPQMVDQPIDRTVFEGTLLWLSAKASSETSMQYQWQKGRVDVFNGGVEEGSIFDIDQGWARSSNMWLEWAEVSHNGYYRVVVSNEFGSVTSRGLRVIVQVEDGRKYNRSFYPEVTTELTGAVLLFVNERLTERESRIRVSKRSAVELLES